MCRLMWVFAFLLLLSGIAGCGDNTTEADRIGVGGQCTDSAQCPAEMEIELECLIQFKGGYCGLEGCEGDIDCPEGSACVIHDDGMNYCFRICRDKPECNYNRSLENESNCSANIVFAEAPQDRKACVPPSSGI